MDKIREQMILRENFNEFLDSYGLKASYVAKTLGISVNAIYAFKSGRGLLTDWQVDRLNAFMADYKTKIGGENDGLENA